MTEIDIINIDGEEIKESDLTPEQRHYTNHVVSLRNRITKFQFEIDDLMPSLNFYQKQLIEITKKQAEEVLSEEEPLEALSKEEPLEVQNDKEPITVQNHK
jgi:hypothetical protein